MLSERTWRGEAVFWLLLRLFVLFCVGQLVWWLLETYILPAFGTDHDLLRMVVSTLSFQGSALLVIALFLREENLTWSQAFGFGWSRTARAILFGILGGIVIVPLAWFLQQVSADVMQYFAFDPQSQEIVKNIQKSIEKEVTPASKLAREIYFAISIIIIAPIAEELLFRGILYPTFKQLGHARLGLWTTSFVFAFLHHNGPSFVPFLVLAVLLVMTYELTDNLLAPILTHSFFNSANFLYLLYEKPVNQFIEQMIHNAVRPLV